ncbi:TetR/AcrR family transcriptional regulator [Streptacidiphilus sp. 4-A2]|nr:TetR/AcrR family transcriptional regulator [Streptacidiphilus sp. 4-A2]
MAEQGTRADTETAQPGARRRVTLTRDAILEAAMHLCSPSGGGVLTFSRLGRELGTDPTAVYRHFRDKDDLVLALTERLIDEALQLTTGSGLGHDQWREWLTLVARSVRSVHLARPALAVLGANRTTASPAETRSVEEIIAVLHRAGLPPVEAAECYRMLLDLTLAFVQSTAAFQILGRTRRPRTTRPGRSSTGCSRPRSSRCCTSARPG